jgi:hypothetical protein
MSHIKIYFFEIKYKTENSNIFKDFRLNLTWADKSGENLKRF